MPTFATRKCVRCCHEFNPTGPRGDYCPDCRSPGERAVTLPPRPIPTDPPVPAEWSLHEVVFFCSTMADTRRSAGASGLARELTQPKLDALLRAVRGLLDAETTGKKGLVAL